MTHVCCNPDCALILARKQREAKEKKEFARRKEEAKPLRHHLKEAEKAINLYVRLRDRHLGCISCNKPAHWDGQWHASHFKSVGSNSVLRYHLWNIHKACSECNLFMSGNIAEYERRLVLKIGADRVEWLKRQNGVKRYQPEYLIRLKKVFNKKSKRLLKKVALNHG
jgi:5-methylcytosine-specific restriction endonuclease McrA